MNAQREFKRLKKSLIGWLEAREKLKAVAQGKTPGNPGYADEALTKVTAKQQELGNKLGRLLEVLSPGKPVPSSTEQRAYALLAWEEGQKTLGGLSPMHMLVLAGVAVAGIAIVASNVADAAKHEAELDYYRSTGQELPAPWYKTVAILGLVGGGAWFLWNKTNLFAKWKR